MTAEERSKTSREGIIAALQESTFTTLNGQGRIKLIDVLGDDHRVASAARLTAQSKPGEDVMKSDRNLLRYLMRHLHTTPIEFAEVVLHVRVPMDCWRQWIRHRTACLSGDTILHFDLPGGIERRGNQLYKLTVKDVFDRFQPTENTQRPDKQQNPYFKRERVQAMRLRCLNDETQQPSHTQIVDIWQSGVKTVYRVELTNGAVVKMSADHLCLTDGGWQRLRDFAKLDGCGSATAVATAMVAVLGPGRDAGVVPQFNVVDVDSESWAPVVGWESYYEVSDQGRVRRIVGGQGAGTFGRCKKLTVTNGKAVVSLNRPGEQVTVLVHREILRSFIGEPADGQEACHNDGNGLNNVLSNLRWDTPASNAADRVRDRATTALAFGFSPVASIEYAGEEMTYDLEVLGPHHNFSANGMVVHNSVNEYSTRYTEAISEKAATPPDQWRLQSKSNRQGSSGEFVEEWPDGFVSEDESANLNNEFRTPGNYLSQREEAFHEAADEVYEERLAFGVAKEVARKDLPLSTFTEAWWKIDLHNLFHFLKLRMDSHAQKEIREYATVIGQQIVKPLFPLLWEAFEDYRLNAISLTRLEVDVVREITASGQSRISAGQFMLEFQHEQWRDLSKCRERAECIEKLKQLGLIGAE